MALRFIDAQHGWMNLKAMPERPIPTGLGVPDSVASNVAMDLFEEMGFCRLKACWMNVETDGLSTRRKGLRMATLGGAEVLGMWKSIGSPRARRKEADIIAVDLPEPHVLPVISPIDALVLSARASDVVFGVELAAKCFINV